MSKKKPAGISGLIKAADLKAIAKAAANDHNGNIERAVALHLFGAERLASLGLDFPHLADEERAAIATIAAQVEAAAYS